jgi:hypothetical protein
MTDEYGFYDDICLSEITDCLEPCALVCINVYDVLLFRHAFSQDELFMETGRRINTGIPAAVFRNLRTEAELRARKEAAADKRSEVTLPEIYRQFKQVKLDVSLAMETEFAVESEAAYVNPNVYSFVKHCHQCGKTIALVADTVFSPEQMKSILSNAGFDFAYADFFLVSSEAGVKAADGGLVRRLCELNPGLKHEQIIYISAGGQAQADLLWAAKNRIKTCWYPVIPELRRGIFAMERDCFSDELNDIAALRALAMNSVPKQYRNGDNKLWFQTGCAAMGTVYTLFADWVCKQTAETGIQKVLCFMREGELLAKFIKRAAERQSIKLDIRQLYISRRATDLLQHRQITADVIFKMCFSSISVQDLFDNVYLDIRQTPFSGIAGKEIGQCRESGEFTAVQEYIGSEAVLDKINAEARKQRRLLAEYVRELTSGENAVTIDLGIQGTVQRTLHFALGLENEKQKLKHIVMVGAMKNDISLLDGIDIKAFITYPDESLTEKPPLEQKAFIYEFCCSADTGVTLRYEKHNNLVVPVLEAFEEDASIVRHKNIFKEGMLAFQTYWLMYAGQKDIHALHSKKSGLYGILRRLIQMPLHHEARLIGSLKNDGGYGTAGRTSIAPPCNESFSKNDIKRFIKPGAGGKEWTHWFEGMTENRFPNYFAEAYYKERIPRAHFKLYDLLYNAANENKTVAVYGAAAVALHMARTAWENGLTISFIVDKCTYLHGMKIYGIPVISPEDSVGKVDLYIIAPLNYKQEIINNIKNLHDGLPQPETVLRTEI